MPTFIAATQTGLNLLVVGEVLLVFAAVLVAISVYLFVAKKKSKQIKQGGVNLAGPYSARTFVLIIAVVLILPGVMFIMTHTTNSSITVGSDYISISGNVFGTQNFSSSDIETAFVGNIHTGNITLSHKIQGLASFNGVVNEGRFKLSNGAVADVITVNTTALFVKTDSGIWLVLGTNDTNSLVKSFSSDVYSISGYA